MFCQLPFAVVKNVIVDFTARGQGVGSTLFKEIEFFA